MTAHDEFSALLHSDPLLVLPRPPKSKPLHSPLPPFSRNKSPNKLTPAIDTIHQSHARSNSDFEWTSVDSTPNRTNRRPPLRAAAPLIPQPKQLHRRIQSDIPQTFDSNKIITKSDLLRNFPDPRWAASKHHYTHYRKRSGSNDLPLGTLSGYGSTTIGHPLLDVDVNVNVSRHVRTRSDASLTSVTANIAKSSMFREFTEKGTLMLQLPKDNFRILMDCSLEAGHVYKRKLLQDEDSLFVEFHTVDDTPNLSLDCPCHCPCDQCHRCSHKQKALPPSLYVMAVENTLYRRMMDEVIESKAMPCGLFFCGHHEDVNYPDIKIAVAIVTMVFVLLFVGTGVFGGD